MPKSTATKPARFEGFADTKLRFFRELAKRQDREWYAAHKQEHQQGWVEPMQALLREVRGRIDRSYPDLELAEPKVFRIHRDVRFSKDKAPYKTNIGGVILARTGGAVMDAPAALYLHLEAGHRFAGGGFYKMPRASLDRHRAALVDAAKGKEIDKLVAALRKKGYELGAAETLKKVPRGFDAEHPRAELLRHKGLVASQSEIPAELLVSRDLVGRIAQIGRDLAPLVRWLTFNAL